MGIGGDSGYYPYLSFDIFIARTTNIVIFYT